MGHILDHVPQTAVLGDSASEKDLLLAYVRHSALCHLGEHGEGGLLHRIADVLQGDALPLQGEGRVDHTRERDVHTLDGIGQLVVLRPSAGQPLNLRAGVEPHAEVPAELVEHVPYADILGLAEDPVPSFCEGYDLGVPAGCVEQGWIPAACERATDLYVGYAVVHPYDRYPHHAREGPRGRGGNPEAGAEPGAHRERDQADVLGACARLVERLLHLDGGDLRMMIGRFTRMEPSLGRTEHVELVGQHVAVRIDDADAQRMGRPLNPHREHWNRA